MTDRLQMMVVEDDRDTAEMLTAYFESFKATMSYRWPGGRMVRQAQAGPIARPDPVGHPSAGHGRL